MALALPGERPPRVLGVILAAAAVLGLCALGCATQERQTRRYVPSVFEAAHFEARRPERLGSEARGGEARGGEWRGDEGARFVERTLHDAGFRFGTDGSARALWGYLRSSHRVVPAASVRPGDILFFDTHGVGPEPDCADHAGVVEGVGADGRIRFVEARGGRVRQSFVDPAHPTARRDDRGEILNSFLRPKAVADPPGARYFAGQMICGIARAERGSVASATSTPNWATFASLAGIAGIDR
jgi:hypothetical protein